MRHTHDADTEVTFRKSSRSGPQGNCTEVGFGDAQVLVRDSKQVGLGGGYDVLSFDLDSWKAFLTHLGR